MANSVFSSLQQHYKYRKYQGNGKRWFILGISLAVILLLIGIIKLFFSDQMMFQTPVITQDPSIITYLEGDVDAFSNGEWTTAEIGMKLKEGDGVRTGSDSYADVRVYQDSVIRLLENSEVILDESAIKEHDVAVNAGLVLAKVRLLFDGQSLRFFTPNAMAAVRGTELVFETTTDGSRIYALSGITEVSGADHPDEPILLAYEKSTEIRNGSVPSNPVPMDPEDIARFRHEINQIHDREVFLITQDILFKPDSAEILSESLDTLDDVARTIRLKRVNILIAGHTADVGNTAAQIKLSEERAQTIREELIDRRVPRRRLEIIGYGGSKPIGDNDTQEGRAQNRRVEFIMAE